MAEEFYQIKIDPPGGEAVKAREVRAVGMDILKSTTFAAEQVLRDPIVENTPHAFGHLRASIATPQPIVTADTILGQVSTPISYARPVETGTKPHTPPIGPLLLWSKRKTGDTRAAYIARAAIRRRGTRGAHMFAKGFQYRAGRIEQMFAHAIENILKQIGARS